MTRAVDEGNVSLEFEGLLAGVATHHIRMTAAEGLVAFWGWTLRTLVDLGIGVAQLNGDGSNLLFFVLDSVDSCDRLNDSGLAVGHVTDRSNVESRLSGLYENFVSVGIFDLGVFLVRKVLVLHQGFYLFFIQHYNFS